MKVLNLNSPVNVFYALLIIYVIIAPVDSVLFVRMLAVQFLILLWGVYLFSLPLKKRGAQVSSRVIKRDALSPNKKKLLILILIQFLSSFYVGQYYTGLSFKDALFNLVAGVSNYSLYQEYFQSAGLAAFSFSKVPAILLNFYVKFLFIFVLFKVFVGSGFKSGVFYSLLATLPVVIQSIYRGTNFELFEILICYFCALYVKSTHNKRYKLPYFKFLLALLVFLLAYTLQISIRYSFNYKPICKNEFCYSDSHFISELFPSISVLLNQLSGYFYFGPDYFARLFTESVTNGNWMEYFLPLKSLVQDLNGKWLCENKIKCGPTWSPDFESFLYFFGLPILLIFIFIISRFQKKLQFKAGQGFNYFLGFYLFTLQIIALPIGNFVLVSSANQILLIYFFGILFLKKITNRER